MYGPKWILAFAVAAVLVGVVPAEGAVVQWRVEDGGNGHWYEYREAPNTWHEAVELSQQASYAGMAGHLVTISTEAENQFVLGLIGTTKCWIGLTDNEAYGGSESYYFGWPDSKVNGWVWITGEPFVYHNLGSAEPEHWPTAGDIDVACMNGEYSGLWADVYANWVDYGFVVEYETVIPEPTTVDIDVKPGSYPNSINLKSKGVVPVAILTSEDFDATTVDPDKVTLAGAPVAHRGKKSMSHEEDVDGDDDLDLVVQVETQDLDASQLEDGEAILTGQTYDGEGIEGKDEIRIVDE